MDAARSTMSSLCSRCESFDIYAFRQGNYEYRGYPLDGLLQTAEAGCSFCTLLREHLLSVENGWRASYLWMVMRKKSKGAASAQWKLSGDNVGLFIKWLTSQIRPPWVHFYVRRGKYIEPPGDDDEQQPLNIKALGAYVAAARDKKARDGRSDRAIWFHLSADPDTPAYISRDITGSLLASNRTGIQPDFDAIRTWHRRCRLNHSRCRVTLSGSEVFDVEQVSLPSRCIEIESENGEVRKCILRETQGQKGKYIALSHRWCADTELVRTLKGNYDCRTGKCTIASCQSCNTPMTTTLFTHAYELSVKLGVNYVWIDSLCIVQDDAEDWKRESAKMADYYQHAWLTVAATRTRNDGGLFGEFETKDLARVTRLPYRDRHGSQKGHFYLQCTGGKAISRDYKNAVGRSDLLRRGWVYQEWLLSRRILAFADFGLFLQCETGNPQSLAGDEVKFIRDDEDGDEWDTAEKPDKSFKNSITTNYSSMENIASGWRKVVEEYSRLELTKLPEDRLVALSGVASEYGRAVEARQGERKKSGANSNDEALQYTYVCGSWFPEIRDLLWEQVERGPRIRAWGIPTWSWASMGTTITTTAGDAVRSGLAVRWSNSYRSSADCVLEDYVRIPVDPITLRPAFDLAEGYTPSNIYGNDGRFAVLGVSGRLMQVRLHDFFVNEDDCTAAANVTGHGPSFGRHMWRRVTTAQTPGTIAGWASVEHPDFQTVASSESDDADDDLIFALFAAVARKVQGGWLLGNLSPHLTAYEVLYLRRIQIPGFETSDRDCYERIGVGRLFGDEVDKIYAVTDRSGVWLV
ncbi:heterokaryon incompatibility protein-domain-containing protein [Xylaria sp. FL0064]|nr:heterokaryon incompatibility protein-domain-containing protein [Xylaria sp. FL0064]